MKNISTGFGLCVAAVAALAYPFVSSLSPSANASAVTAGAAAVGSAVTARVGQSIIWMGVTSNAGGNVLLYHRLWSDGRLEARFVVMNMNGGCVLTPSCAESEWTEVPPPPSGNGFACRADLDGNRVIDGADLGVILANWGPQTPCAPEATYPCLTLNQPLLK